MQHEFKKEQINLKEHEKKRDEEIKRKMHHDEKNLQDELNRYEMLKETELESMIAELNNKHSEKMNTRNFEFQAKLKEVTEKNLNEVKSFKDYHEDLITKLKIETENEIVKNRGIINFSQIELSNLGLDADWDMTALEDRTEHFKNLIEDQNINYNL